MTSKDMDFRVLYKGLTSKGSNYYKLEVEIATGLWEEATYFGNTVPKKISSLKLRGDYWIAQIQPHTSRDRDTGRFKGKRELTT